MNEKDYRRFGYPMAKKSARSPRRIDWVLIVLIAILVGGMIYWFSRYPIHFEKQKFINYFASIKSVFSHQNKPNIAITKTESAPQEQSIHFSFYNELPNVQIANKKQIPDTAVAATPQNKKTLIVFTNYKSAPPPVAPANPVMKKTYIVEIAVFKNKSEASQMRISLLLEGLEVTLQKVNAQGETVYKLQQGPFADLAQAKLSQKRLEKKGVSGSVQEVSN